MLKVVKNKRSETERIRKLKRKFSERKSNKIVAQMKTHRAEKTCRISGITPLFLNSTVKNRRSIKNRVRCMGFLIREKFRGDFTSKLKVGSRRCR